MTVKIRPRQASLPSRSTSFFLPFSSTSPFSCFSPRFERLFIGNSNDQQKILHLLQSFQLQTSSPFDYEVWQSFWLKLGHFLYFRFAVSLSNWIPPRPSFNSNLVSQTRPRVYNILVLRQHLFFTIFKFYSTMAPCFYILVDHFFNLTPTKNFINLSENVHLLPLSGLILPLSFFVTTPTESSFTVQVDLSESFH